MYIMIIWFFCHLDYWRGYLYTEINLINSEEKTFFHYSDQLIAVHAY